MYGKGCVTLWADCGHRGGKKKEKKRGSKQYHHNSSVERDVLAVALAVRWTEALTVNGCDVCGSSISVGLL